MLTSGMFKRKGKSFSRDDSIMFSIPRGSFFGGFEASSSFMGLFGSVFMVELRFFSIAAVKPAAQIYKRTESIVDLYNNNNQKVYSLLIYAS